MVMKSLLLLVVLLSWSATSLPYLEQMLLANSMIVGRDDAQDLIDWDCNVCDPSNRPLHSHYIENNEKDIKCILATYPTFVVLAFRYTNTLLNVWQDILYANQVVDTNICSNCKIQRAYKKMWDSIVSNVLNDLRDIQKQTGLKRIYITGISLGGGLSVISYIDVVNSKSHSCVDRPRIFAKRIASKLFFRGCNSALQRTRLCPHEST